MSDSRLAWHFLHPNNKLRTGKTAPADGKWLTHTGPIVPCESGVHASERLIDALDYIPAEDKVVLCRVELAGTIVEHGDPVDKLAASERRILWRLDGDTTDRVLREHARWSARQVLHLWKAPVPQIVTDFLETGSEDLRAAAWEAAWEAAWAAARAAAWAAAWEAAWAAAWAAAWEAARAAAWAAARAAARAAQNAELERLAVAAHEAQS